MANVSELDLQNHGTGVSEITNYISQINVGETVYDIATHHGIKFRNGTGDPDGTTWNGITDIEVIIPSLTDLVQNPIKFAGTVGSDGTVTPPKTPEKGDLVYITADCQFPTTGNYCEAGDMAVYDGTAWRVISGENQVSIVGIGTDASKTFTLNATAADVLTVEGQTLKLAVDYTGVKDVMTVDKNSEMDIDVANGKVAVESKYVGLSYAAGSKKDITESVSIDLPTALANGDVAISQNVLVASNFTFTSGEFPTLSKNSSAIVVETSHSIALAKNSGSDFVATIDSALKSVSIIGGDAGSNDLAYVSEVTKEDGSVFVSGIHVKASDETATADFVIPGKASMNVSTFVSGLSDAAASGDVVSSITVGAVNVDDSKTDFLSGLTSGSEVVTAVSFGDVVEDNTKQWFATGFGSASTAGDVVSSISVGAVTLKEDNTYAKSAMVGASVNNHVLSFSTDSFMKPMNVDQAATTMSFKSLNKGGVKLSGQDTTKSGFNTAGFTQADTTISYKSVLTGNVSLSYADDTAYIFDKKAETSFSVSKAYKKLDVVAATITSGAYGITGGVTASVPADKVVVAFDNTGTLPSFSVGAATGTLTGSVGTSLASTSKSWLAVAEANKDIDLDGTYTLVESNTAETGYIDVAKAGTYDLASALITIDKDTFITSVKVSGTAISKS